MEASQLRTWCQKELSSLMGNKMKNESDLLSHLLSLPNESAIEEYIGCLLQGSQHCKRFTREYLVRWRSMKEEQEIMVPLKRLDDDQMVLFENKKTKHKKKPSKTAPPGFESTNQSAASSAKSKYVPLLSGQGQDRLTVNIPGRHPCQCLGQKHDLINNCLECGRIICKQEGAGPCLFCGTVVFTRDEEHLLTRDSKRAEKQREKMWTQYNIKGDNPVLSINQSDNDLAKATEHKDRLVHYDKTSTKRTKVVDDESDYFRVDSQWISPEERKALRMKEEELRNAKYGSRTGKGIKVTLDIAGQEITEEDHKNIDIYSEDHIHDISANDSSERRYNQSRFEVVQDGVANPWIPIMPPVYLGKKNESKNKKSKANIEREGPLRLQDRAFLEMRDEGQLQLDNYRFEGRSWYTPHRGKLWIASTAKPPEQRDIDELEEHYKQLYKGTDIEFPDSYPHACLLGCVDLVDCLSLDECRDKYPECDSESPFVFVCETPQELKIKFPIKGKHKIWKLDSDIHQSAKRGFGLL